jgi:hypothetical protein
MFYLLELETNINLMLCQITIEDDLRQICPGEHLTRTLGGMQIKSLYIHHPSPTFRYDHITKHLLSIPWFLVQEKNPRFREKGDSDEEDDDFDKKRRR